MEAFELQELRKQSVLQKLFGALPKENSVVEVNNLFHTKGVKSVTHEDIVSIEEKYKVKIAKKYSMQVEQFYKRYLEYCLTDKVLTDEELDELRHIKDLFKIRDKTVDSITRAATSAYYKQEVEALLQDRRLDIRERAFLEKLQKDIRIPEEYAQKIYQESAKTLLEKFLDDAVSDERISPEEENELQAIAKSLNVTIDMDEASNRLFEKYKLCWQIENGDLPVLDTRINLQRKESCHFVTSVNWLEQRRITKRINYGGPTLRIKIAKGLYWRMGSIGVRSISEDVWTRLDSGNLYLTTKRLIFMGGKGNKTIRLANMLDFTPFKNGVDIQKDSGRSPFLEFDKNVDIFCMILGRLIRDL